MASAKRPQSSGRWWFVATRRRVMDGARELDPFAVESQPAGLDITEVAQITEQPVDALTEPHDPAHPSSRRRHADVVVIRARGLELHARQRGLRERQ